ncbi:MULTISPECIES: AsmA family protein [unclassified Iodidimonas]|jgi:uncharacterized protein involved in outer membrane biogenesis|uniref:AsmA family protein n=1 Tax=unclassified Iodidimonas TaxID=2626145 RepID=UPI002482F4F6|nr:MULTISPECIES: AsmA family protein [unclassified Iodidimonas]
MQEDEQQKPPKSSLNSVFWRRAGWAMLGLVLSLLALAMIAPLFIDWNAYRPRMEAALAAATGRDVVIGGDLSVRTVPALALRAGDVRIGNHEGGVAANLVAMDRFDVVIALFPLLKGDLKIRRIALLAPIVALERSADGRENWRLPIFMSPEAGEPSAVATPSGTVGDRDRFSLDDLRIKNGVVRYHDDQSDRTFHLNEIDIALEVQALAGPYRLQMAAQSGDIPLELELKADRFAPDRRTPLSVRLEIDEARLGLSGWIRQKAVPLSDADPLSSMKALPDFSFKLDAKTDDLGQFLGNFEAVARAFLPIAWLQAIQNLPQTPGLDKAFDLKARLLSDGSLTLDDLRGKFGKTGFDGRGQYVPGAAPRLAVDFHADQLDLDPFFAASPAKTDGRTAFKPDVGDETSLLPTDLALDLSVAIDAARYRDQVISRIGLKAHADEGAVVIDQASANLPGASDLSFKGRMGGSWAVPKLAGEMAASSSNLRALLGWLGIEPLSASDGRQEVLNRFSVSAHVAADPTMLALDDLALVLDASRISGRLALSGFDGPLGLAADLDLDRLDLDDYLGPAPADAPPFSLKSMAEMANEGLRLLAPYDLDMKLKARRLTIMGQILRAISLGAQTLNAGGQQAAFTIESLDLKGPADSSLGLSGSFRAGDGGPQIDGLIRLASPDPAALLAQLKAGGADISALELIADLGPVAIEGRITGPLADTEMDMTARLAGGRMTLRGKPGPLGLAPDGPIDLALGFDHPSHRALAERFHLPAYATGDALPVHLDMRLGGLLSAADFAGEGRLLGGQLEFSGHVSRGFSTDRLIDVTLRARHPALGAFLRQLIPDHQPPARDLGAVDLALKARHSGDEGLAINLQPSHLGQTTLAGSLHIKPQEKRPFWQVDLELGDVVAADFGGAKGAGAPSSKSPMEWSHVPFDASALAQIDGRFQIRAKSLRHGAFLLTNPAFDGRLQDAVLTIESIDAGLFGGHFLATGQVDATAMPAIAFDFDGQSLAMAEVMQSLFGYQTLSGQAAIKGSLSAQGASPFDLVSALKGRARLDMADGAIRAFDLPGLISRIQSAKKPADLAGLAQRSFGGGRTAFSHLGADLVADKGMISSDQIRADLAGGVLDGRATLDLAAWALSMKGKVALGAFPKAPAIGFDLGGSLAGPRAAFDTDPLQRWLAGRLVDDVFRRLQLPGKGQLRAPEIVGGPEDGPESVNDKDRDQPPDASASSVPDPSGTD